MMAKKSPLDELLLKIIGDAVHKKRRFFDLDDRHAWLLYAILQKEHTAVTGSKGEEDAGQAPGATRDHLVQLGWKDATGIHRAIHKLEDAGYISIGDFIPEPSGKPVEIYEINTKTCITTRHAAIALSVLLKICDGAKAKVQDGEPLTGDPVDQEGRVLISSLIDHTLRDDRLAGEDQEALREILRGEDQGNGPYLGKIQELVDAGEHLERASHLHVRPRLRLFLEKRYIELVARQPDRAEVKRMFGTFRAPPGNRTADEQE